MEEWCQNDGSIQWNDLEVCIVFWYPNSWMGYFMENPNIESMIWGYLFVGNLHLGICQSTRFGGPQIFLAIFLYHPIIGVLNFDQKNHVDEF
jgi:hypothetical protein